MRPTLPALFLLFLCCEARGLRILGIFPLHGKSHWVMMERLSRGLAQRGHQMDVVTHFPLKTLPPNYREISLAGSMPQVMNNLTAADMGKFGSFNMKEFVKMTGEQICDLLRLPQLQQLVKNPPNDPPYDVVIVELFTAPCYLPFGRLLNAPVVGVMTCAFHDWMNDVTGNPLNTAITPSMFSPYTTQMTFTERLTNTLLTNYISIQIKYYTRQQRKYVKEIFGMDVEVDELYKDLSLILVNSHHSLSGVRPYTPAIVEVGGLHLTDDNDPLPTDVKKWLDESKHGCFYFTFGSMMRIETFPKHTLEAFFKAFEKAAPVRVLMKIAKIEELQLKLPKNVMAKPWFSQIAVLKHKNVKGFITHGGLMGTQESIFAGVPMIAVPLFGDQHVNANIYARKKVALLLTPIDEIREENVTDALNTILNEPSYTENVKKLQRAFLDRPMSALDTAIYWVEYVARNGNALQSPAIHLQWWQRNCLDVYAALGLALAAVVAVLILVVRALKNAIFPGRKPARKPAGEESARSKKNK